MEPSYVDVNRLGAAGPVELGTKTTVEGSPDGPRGKTVVNVTEPL